MLHEPGKKLGIMQPYFFPYPGYFQLLHAIDTLVFYDDVNFIKNGWINRNRLLLDGGPAYFTVPLANASSFERIHQVRVSTDTGWRRKLLEKMRHAYARAPQYAAVIRMVEGVVEGETASIGDLARQSVQAVAEYLSLPCQIVPTSRAYGNDRLKGEERVIDICVREQAATYINVPGGRMLYEPRHFARQRIRLGFINPQLAAYPQFSGAHIPALSIIDLLMFNDRQAARDLLRNYTVEFPAAEAPPPPDLTSSS